MDGNLRYVEKRIENLMDAGKINFGNHHRRARISPRKSGRPNIFDGISAKKRWEKPYIITYKSVKRHINTQPNPPKIL